jgi:thiol-disulfide isomerase/thioredoxin
MLEEVLMAAVLLLARFALIVVFGVAGLTKLTDREGSRRMLVEFGVPAPLAGPLGLILPLVELAVAAALIPAASAWWGAIGALIFLMVFAAGIGVNLARGRTPDCRCFGQLHAEPAGPSTLVRDLVLAAVAGVVVVAGSRDAGPSMIGWLSLLDVRERAILTVGSVALGLSLAEALIVIQLLRQQGRLLLRIEALETRAGVAGAAPTSPGLPLGAPAPSLALRTLDDGEVVLEDLWSAGKPALLVFTNTNCEPCNQLMPDIAHWERQLAVDMTVAVIAEGSIDDNRAKAAKYGIRRMLLQRGRDVAESYGAITTPSAVLVRPDGIIGSSVVSGADEIHALVGRVPGVHKPAPHFRLPDLDGRIVDLLDFRGSKTLVVFWSPFCGFCEKMLDDLKAWEENPPRGAPGLLIVSTGDVAANRAQGFRSTVLLDQDFATARAFGAEGTPSSVLVDAQGELASELAVGANGIFALAGVRGKPQALALA